MSKNKRRYVRRYTNLESLRYLLCTKAITLIDPQEWDDRNDSHYLRLYKKEKKLKSLLVLCLTRVTERYHLWKVFGHEQKVRSRSAPIRLLCGPYKHNSPLANIGVRIRFDRKDLIQAMRNHRGVRWDDVEYLTLSQIGRLAQERQNDPLASFPFLKRYGFQDEKEFRIIYESKTEDVPTKDIPIPLSCISKIIFSPRLDRGELTQIRKELHLIEGCHGLTISRSTLTDSETWQRAGENAVKAAGKVGFQR